MGKKKIELDLIQLQYQEAVTTIRTQLSLLIQVEIAFVIGNITITGFAFENKSASLFILGSIFPIGILVINHLTKRLMIPIFRTCIEIEEKFLKEKIQNLVTGFVSTIKKNDKLSDINDFTFSRSIFRYVLLFISLIQIAFGISLNYIFEWKFI